MGAVAILTAVALALTHKNVTVYGHAPPSRPWTGRTCGWTFYPPPYRIYLRYPRKTVRLWYPAVTCFAHELLHVEHPAWPHWKVYFYQYRYEPVVARAIIRQRKMALPLDFQG